jgi:hypothetical protein
MKSLVFMMMLSMFLVSAGVVYLSINRDPLGGVPHVDVPLDPAPPETQASAPAPEAAIAATPPEPAEIDATALPGTAGTASDAGGSAGALTVDVPPADLDSDEPLTVTTFPIPQADEAPAATGEAAATADPAQ